MEGAGKILALFFTVSLYVTLGGSCVSPQVDSKVYTTTEAITSTETVFIVQFSVKCKDGSKGLNLYADVNGKTMAVTKAVDGSKFDYQVSHSGDHKSLPSGQYNVKFYDEEGYNTLRKAQRSGESTDSVKSLFTIPVNHPGVWKGAFVQSEFVAAMVAILVWYLAYTAKSKLQSS